MWAARIVRRAYEGMAVALSWQNPQGEASCCFSEFLGLAGTGAPEQGACTAVSISPKAGIRDGLHLIALSRLVRDRAKVCVRALDAPAFCSLGLGREPLGARKFVAAISKRRLTVSATGDLALAQNVAWRPRWFLGVSALRRAPTWRAAGRSRLKNST